MSSNNNRMYGLCTSLIVVAFGLYLFANHFVQAYSDPTGWLNRAVNILRGDPTWSRAIVYPAFLSVALQVVGPIYIWIVNLPFLLACVLFVYYMTRSAAKADVEPHGRSVAAAAGVYATIILIFRNYDLMRVMLNPYREALAFCLLLGGIVMVLASTRKGALVAGLWSGFLVGLSISVRETGVLVLPTLSLLFWGKMRKPGSRARRTIALFVLGTVVGLMPLFVQNRIQSGKLWVPAYAAHEVEKEAASAGAVEDAGGAGVMQAILSKLPRDIPIPGMSVSHFSRVGREAIRFLYGKYGWWGWALFFIGLLFCSVKRRTDALILFAFTPAVYLLFYSFYWYVKERYFFAVDIFAVPLMGIGAAVTVDGVYRLAARVRAGRRDPHQFVLPVLSLMLLAVLLAGVLRKKPRLQVWHIAPLREEVLSKLKEEPVFISTSTHKKNMMRWLLQADTLEQDFANGLDEKLAGTTGLTSALGSKAKTVLETTRLRNVYSVGDNTLLREWCDLIPAFSLRDISVPLDHYGERLDDTVFALKPWSQTNRTWKLALGRQAERQMLMVNCYRLWDYPERTWCRLYVNDVPVEDKVPNGLHYVDLGPELVRGRRTIDVRVSSDAALPERPYMETHAIGDSFSLRVSPLRYYPYLRGDLIEEEPTASSCFLYHGGSLQLPSFAETSECVYAEFHLSEYREDPDGFEGDYGIRIRAGTNQWAGTTPGRRQSVWTGIKLGRGSGRLCPVDVTFTTDIPSHAEQRLLKKAGKIDDYMFLKVNTVRVGTFERAVVPEMLLDIGSPGDGPYILDGFHDREKSGTLSARWTTGAGRISLPLASSPGGTEICVTVRNARPESVWADPSFRLNGVPFSAKRMMTETNGIPVSVYRFSVTEDVIEESSGNSILEIISAPWIPSEILNTRDSRELGQLVVQVAFQPLAGPRE